MVYGHVRFILIFHDIELDCILVCYIFSVAVGVMHFKAGENSKAMKYFDHALEIDDSNVEGLVARGAL